MNHSSPQQGYSDEPLERILFHIETGTVVNLDRWMLTVFPVPNEGASRTVRVEWGLCGTFYAHGSQVPCAFTAFICKCIA